MKVLLALVLATAIAAVAGAEGCVPTTTSPDMLCSVPMPELAGFYVDDDCCYHWCLFSLWIYQESNGIEGLQRNDEVVDDTCGGMIRGDTIIF